MRLYHLARIFSLALAAVSFSPTDGAQSAPSAPPSVVQPRAWYQDLMAHAPEKLMNRYPHRVIIIKKLRKKDLPEFVLFPPDPEGAKSPFLTLVSEAQLNLFLSSNGITPLFLATGEPKSPTEARDFWYKLLLNPVLADTLVVMKKSKDGSWDIIKSYGDGSGLHNAAKVKAPKADNLARAEYFDWLTRELGYNGVVIDVKGDLALIGMYEQQAASTGKLQALALKNSSNRFSMKKLKQKGAGILESKVIDGPLGTFAIMLSAEGESIVPGTKVIVQKNLEENEIDSTDKPAEGKP